METSEEIDEFAFIKEYIRELQSISEAADKVGQIALSITLGNIAKRIDENVCEIKKKYDELYSLYENIGCGDPT